MKKIAIVCLTHAGPAHDMGFPRKIIERNQSIENVLMPVLKKYEVQNFILHEGDISNEMQNNVTSQTPNLNIRFEHVKEFGTKTAFNDSKIIINDELCPPPQGLNFTNGYLHMCHFWSYDVLDYFAEYDYVIRIDDDCIITNVSLDEMEQLFDADIHFSTVAQHNIKQDMQCTVGLEKFLVDFCSKNGINDMITFGDIHEAYSCFMIINVKHYRNNTLVQSFLKEIEKTNCFYSNRWSDSAIWGVISCVVDKEGFYKLKNFSYWHHSHFAKIDGMTNETHGYEQISLWK